MRVMHTKRMTRVTFAFLALGVAKVASAQTTAALPLKDLRSQLTLPSYTPEERQAIADQSFLILDKLFVHRELKIQEFGAGHDPVPRIAEIQRHARSMTDADLQNAIAGVFLDLHDLHSNYHLPAPLGCGTVFLPVQFIGVRDAGVEKVVVGGVLPIGTDSTKDIKPGFQLTSVNDRPIEEALKDLGELSGGANPDAMRYRAIQLLSLRSLQTQAVPQEDTVRLHLVGPTGAVDVELPWLTKVDDKCMTGAVPEVMPFSRAMTIAEDEYQKRYNRIYGQPRLGPDMQLEDLSEPDPLADIFEVAMLTTPAGKLGYIRLKSFYWTNPNLEVWTVVDAFRTAVETKLAGARALVIDVRSNPGGFITLAEKILQLFTPTGVEPTTVRMLANDINEKIFVQSNGRENRWSEAIRAAVNAGQTYTAPLAITSDSEANDLGQLWFLPVVVLTNPACYSACDLFAAGMQDNRAATIIGTHRTTGAGGANVMEYATFQKIMEGASTNPFKNLPHRQSMRISWRQVLRAGAHKGKLIEGQGIQSDITVPLTTEDLQSESRPLMTQIHEAIKRMEPNFQAAVRSRPYGFVRLTNDAMGSWTEEVKGIDRLVVSDGDQVLLDKNLTPSNDFAPVAIDLPTLSSTWRDHQITLKGWRGGRQVFRVARTLAWRGDYVKVADIHAPLTFDANDLGLLHAYSLGSDESDGWQVKNGKLQVGASATYGSNVHTRALLPLELGGKGATLSFELAVKAEELFDTLRCYALNPDTGERLSYFAGSDVPQQTVSLKLPPGWERADFVLEFESDENWNLETPRIDNLKVSAP